MKKSASKALTPFIKGLAAALMSSAVMNAGAVTTPTSFFESSVITGSKNRISVQRVPVVDVNGKVTYKNLTIDFTVSNTGVLLDKPALITAAPVLLTSNFVAGKYKDGKGYTYALSGPSVVPGTSRTAWSLIMIAAPTGSNLVDFSLNWITGVISGHPIEAMLKKDGLTTTNYSWGTVGANGINNIYGVNFAGWPVSAIVGAIQSGNQLSIHLYNNDANNVEDGFAALLYCPTC